MAKEEKQYKVTAQFPDGVSAEARRRAGVDVHRVYGYTGSLTKEQLEAIAADPYLTVTDASAVDTPEDELQASEVIRNAENQAGTIVADAEAKAAETIAQAEAKAEETLKAAKSAGDKIVADANAKAKTQAK